MSNLDLILVECPNCHGEGPPKNLFGLHCPDCEGSGWVLVEGTPIDLADLERMAPWAEDFETVASFDLSIKTGRPLESGEVEALSRETWDLQRQCFRIALGPGMG